MSDETLNIVFHSDPKSLEKAENFMREAIKRFALAAEIENAVLLAVSEAVTNSMMHGNKWDKNKKVELTAELKDNKLIIIIKDEGHGFDPLTVPDPTSPENLLKDNGRGVFIMKSYVNEVMYKRLEDGFETILVFNL